MGLTIVPQGPEHREEVAAFNQRLKEALGQPPFLLPLDPRPAASYVNQIRAFHYVALEEGRVRGGYLVVLYPCLLNGVDVVGASLQAPLSESVADKRFRYVGRQMIEHVLRDHPLTFCVGMNSLNHPLPRRLRSLGWSVEEVPFFFRVHCAASFLKQMPMLQSPWPKRLGSWLAAASGIGAVGRLWLHRRSRRLPRHFELVRERSWGLWADSVWDVYRRQLRFGVRRDAAVLTELYPPQEPRMRIFRILAGDESVGWAAALLTQMHDNRYFGNLRVGTVLDAAARPEAFFAVAALVDEALGSEGADLVITNQSLPRWQQAFLEAGFRRGPSNFLFAGSPAIVEALSPTPIADGLVQAVRGDGGGRLNL
jgi:hypothetical protein